MRFRHKRAWSNLLLLVILIVAAAAWPARPAAAVSDAECAALAPLEWVERAGKIGSILIPATSSQEIFNYIPAFTQALEENYARLQLLFAADLDLPLTVRLYPNLVYYQCYNPQAPQVGQADLMIALGAREIALFEENILADAFTWDRNYVNSLRYELGYLFGRQLTENNAPPGLLVGVAVYMQDPLYWMSAAQLTPNQSDDSVYTAWRTIWEEPVNRVVFQYRRAAASTVAYLVDLHGWPRFVNLLDDIRTSGSYRTSLERVYRLEFSDMETEWRQYLQVYNQGRWKAHVLYNFDLSPYQKMITAGAYVDAETEVKKVIQFLEQTNQAKLLPAAQAILETAQAGQRASELLIQARQALLDGRYQQTLAILDQAEAAYRLLEDSRRQTELDQYRDWAEEVLQLRQESQLLLDQLQSSPPGERIEVAKNLAEKYQRLVELRDTQTAAQINAALRGAQDQQSAGEESRMLRFAGLGAALLLLRIALMFRKIPIEAGF